MKRPISLRRLSTLPAWLLLLHCSAPSESGPQDGARGGAAGAGAVAMTSGSGHTGGSTTAGSASGGSASGGSASGGSVNAGGAGQTNGGGNNAAGAAGGNPAGGMLGVGGNGQAGSGQAGSGQAGSSQAGSGQGGKGQGGSTGVAGGTSGTGGTGPRPDDTTIAMTIPTPSNGQGEVRNATTVLKNAANGGKNVWDFDNQKIGVKNTAECEGGEGQVTVFEVEDGVTVRNLIIAGGIAGGNGIVCKGSCTLEYVYWEDVCEDAATNSKDGATMTLNHIIALKATDKVFQHNAKGGSKTILKNSYISDFGKLWRSCGDCDSNGGPRHLTIDNVRVDGIKTAVAGANQNYGDTVTITNLYVKGGYNASTDKPKICTEYIGVTDHNGESTKVDDGKSRWNTSVCKVSQANVKSY